MIYNQIDGKQNITSLKSSGKDVITKNKEKKLFINEKLINENVDDFFISGDNQFILFNVVDGSFSFKKDFSFIKKSTRFFLNFNTNNKNLIIQTDIELNTYLYLNTNKLENEIELMSDYNWEFIFLDSNLLYLYDKTILKAMSYSTYKYQWEVTLKDYGEIRKILGVKENKLWISMHRGGNDKTKNSLIALNINSGHIVYEKSNDYDTSDWFIELISEYNSILSIYGKISTTPADSPLVEINATTGEIIRNQKIESLYNENLKIGFWKVLKDKIYFTANKDALNGNHIGVLDYNTLQILWVTKIDNMKGTFKDLQITENKIYALDTANQLHVYEKE